MTPKHEKTPHLRRIHHWMKAHKIASLLVLLVIFGAAYYAYGQIRAANTVPQYLLSLAHIGTITQTVTGSAQVSAENQLDVTSEVSGKIQSINVVVGQHVSYGDLLATIESKDAYINLETARIAYAKLIKPAKEGDVTNAQNTLAKSYNDGFNAISTAYLDLPDIISGLKDMLYSRTGFLSDQNSSYLISTGRDYRNITGISYDKAVSQYEMTLLKYKGLSRSSATSSLDQLLADTSTTVKMVAGVLQNAQNAITYIVRVQPEYQTSSAVTAASDVNSWSTQINNDLSAIVSAQNTIVSSNNSLNTLLTGAEDLDIQSQRLSVEQAEQNYAKYFIRSPFDGIVGRIPVTLYSQAGTNTVIATVASNRKITTIPLNEVDAVKVQKGNRVTLTFDALSGVIIDGEVVEVDLVGTASQGVVTYNVKIAFDDNDKKVRTGMSVDATIITEQKNGVLIVPSSAVKGQGQKKYVEVIDDAGAVKEAIKNADSTIGNRTDRNRQNQPIMISSKVTPRRVMVIVGDSDDINTEILSGLNEGQSVIIRTIVTGTATAQTTAPSIFNSFGGGSQRGGTGGAVRAISR